MMDTEVVLTLSVLGSILSLAFGQNYGYANMRLGNRRVQPFFVRQQAAPQLPGLMLGQRRQASPLGGTFRGIPVGGASPFPARGAANSFFPQQGVQGVGGAGLLSAATTPTTPTPPSQPSEDQKKLVDMLVHVITKNHEAKLKAQTTPAPVASARAHSQSGSAEPHSHVIVHSHGENRQPHVHVAPLSKNVRNPLAPNSRLINSQPTSVPDILSASSGIPETNHRRANVPDVLSSMPGSIPTRQNHHSTLAEHNLQVPNPLQSGIVDEPHKPNNLLRFLTGENKKTTPTRHVNSALLKPTHMSVVPIRKQIPPPSQTTQPTNTKPFTQASPKKEFEEDEEQEEEGEPDRSPPLPVPSGQRPNFTQLTPPNSQILAPRPVPLRPVPTTQEPMVTSVSASTPTTMPVPHLIPGAINPFENQHVVKPPGQ